jgi:ATP-dependent DNA ligase
VEETKWPTLFKKTSTGAIQQWTISCNLSRASETGDDEMDYVSTIVTTYGQIGSDKMQTTFDRIKEGKNAGKKNETTAFEQAQAEANAKYEKQLKKGYVTSPEAAEAGEVSDLIQGGISPMLAQSFSKHANKIKYPCYAQPKFDGTRMIAVVESGKCTLWSRTRKPITSCPHIVAELERMFPDRDIILDGEAYNFKYKANFEKLISLIRQEVPAPDHTEIQYHVYDQISSGTFEERWTELVNIFFEGISYVAPGVDGNPIAIEGFTYCIPCHTVTCESDDAVTELFIQLTNIGHEGIILRNADGLYVNKRSYDLQKVKTMLDDEFDIVGIEEGRGRLMGHVGAFICKDVNGNEFKAKMCGDTEMLRKYFGHHDLWKNKKLTVQYQGLTAYGIPRFPVGKAIRDYE